MKQLLYILVLSSFFTLSACAEEVKPVTTPPEVKEAPATVIPEPIQPKKVCIKVLDNKTNKLVEKCRTMKIHNKHEGTKVPTK